MHCAKCGQQLQSIEYLIDGIRYLAYKACCILKLSRGMSTGAYWYQGRLCAPLVDQPSKAALKKGKFKPSFVLPRGD